MSMARQFLYVDPKELQGQMYLSHGNHLLIIGATGSGKTSSLMKVTYNLWKVGETIIWRDDANLEFLSFLPYIDCKLYLPEGCDLHLDEVLAPSMLKRVEKVHYDWHRPGELMPSFDNERLNILLFDLFTIDLETSVRFWTQFFWELYRYKRQEIKEPWSLVIDELNDLAPGKARGTFAGQLRLSSSIYHSLKKYRKMNLRLVASTHNFNDLHAPLRGQFNYYLLKRMRREHVPERFVNYAHVIERMSVRHAILVDRYGNFQFIYPWTEETRWHEDMEKLIKLKPQRWKIPWSGEVREEEEDEKGRRGVWKKRALLLLRLLDELDVARVDYNFIRRLFGLAPGYSSTLSQMVREIPDEEVAEALKLLDVEAEE